MGSRAPSSSTPRTLRIAVLEADTPIGHTKEKYGGYGNLFAELLGKGAARVRDDKSTPAFDLAITKFDVVATEVYPDLDKIDAVLISGSKWNAYDNDPWIQRLVTFTQRVLQTQTRVRVIGVCFGHQIVGRALDAHVGVSARGWEVSVVPVMLTVEGKRLFGSERLRIHQMHRDVVQECPAGVLALGRTERCAVQGMYQPARLLCVQGHPEFSAEIVKELLERRYEQGIFDEAMFRDAMGRVEDEHDGVLIAAAFLRFLLEGR